MKDTFDEERLKDGLPVRRSRSEVWKARGEGSRHSKRRIDFENAMG